jgi:type IV secretion system protein VirB9
MKPEAFLAAGVAALVIPHIAFAADARIREIAYDPTAVTTLHGCFDYQSTVVFAPGEKVENVALGDAGIWQATPNKRADLLFLKPSVRTGRTNMMVVTDRRRYAFDLIARDDAACRGDRTVYELQFRYQEEPPPPPAPVPAVPVVPAAPAAVTDDAPPPASRNTAYTFTGAPADVPMRAFDDGRSTWLRWAEGAAAPAIYTVGPDKKETVVNYAIKGDYVVVDGVAPRFILRRGGTVAVLYNDAYQQPTLDADAPRPHAETSRRRRPALARLFGPPPAPVSPPAAAVTQESAQ